VSVQPVEGTVVGKRRVCAAADIPEGAVRVVQCGERSLAVSHLDGAYYAIDNVCTHDNGPLGEGRLQRGRVICPRHGAAFDAKTGKVLSLPAVRDVRAFETVAEGEDVLVDCGSDGEGAGGGAAGA
jgi:3-phenylpropionate/trans-cinnamate dioxygenase ferredoxin subunit